MNTFQQTDGTVISTFKWIHRANGKHGYMIGGMRAANGEIGVLYVVASMHVGLASGDVRLLIFRRGIHCLC